MKINRSLLLKPISAIVMFWLLSDVTWAVPPMTIRLGVQASGTLAWELPLLQAESINEGAGYALATITLANPEAGKVALLSGAVDLIVSDWIWVSRQRAEGNDLAFYPYSTASGSLMVPDNSTIRDIKDLKAKRLGIAGGELDKNWLLLQALAQRQAKLDLNASVEKVFGAPPLINEQLSQGRVDAALNYWHFGAKLEAHGFRQVINGQGILEGLGIKEALPTLGFVFKQSWAEQHKTVLESFLAASKHAKQTLCSSEAEWQKIIPLTQPADVPMQNALRQRYCEGEVTRWGTQEQQAAGRVYEILHAISNGQLTGKSDHLQPSTFWQP